LTGPYVVDGMEASNSHAPMIRGNSITGATRSGLIIRGKALEMDTVVTVVTHNVIANNPMGLDLSRISGNYSASSFGAQVFLNDITGSTVRAVDVLSSYTFPTELSVNGMGNYWGHTCLEGGFLSSDSPNITLIHDSHPFGQSVANTPDDLLPSPCF
jgi:hypothetical protein